MIHEPGRCIYCGGEITPVSKVPMRPKLKSQYASRCVSCGEYMLSLMSHKEQETGGGLKQWLG